jgi:hypothetical protein
MYMYRTQGGFNYLFHGQAQDEHTTLFRQQAGKKIKKMATLRRENRVRANGITRQGSRRSSRGVRLVSLADATLPLPPDRAYS